MKFLRVIAMLYPIVLASHCRSHATNGDPRKRRPPPFSGCATNARGQRPSASSASARSAALRSSAVFCTHVGWTSCQLKTSLLLDHTSRPQQDGRRNRDAERLCRPRIEDQIDFRRLFNGEVPGPGPLQDPVDVDGAPPP